MAIRTEELAGDRGGQIVQDLAANTKVEISADRPYHVKSLTFRPDSGSLDTATVSIEADGQAMFSSAPITILQNPFSQTQVAIGNLCPVIHVPDVPYLMARGMPLKVTLSVAGKVYVNGVPPRRR